MNARRTARLLAFSCLAAAEAVPAAQIQATVTGADGKPVAQAVVTLKPTGNIPVPEGNPKSVVMDQVDKEFVPMVVPVQAGGAVSFPNRDNIRHHVYSFSAPKTFELKLYSGVPSKPVVFDKPGVITLGCNIHDWMVGYIFVADTPWFAKTGADGTASIDAPAGEYTVRVWHPWSSAIAEQKVRADAAPARLAFRLSVVPPPVPARK
jgi:plastocyanin